MAKSRIAEAYVTAVITMDGVGDDIADKLKTGFKDATEKVKAPVEKESEKVGNAWAGKFAAGIAASGALAGIGAVVTGAISEGINQSDINKKLVGALVLTDADAKKVTDASKGLFTGGYTETYEEAAEAMKNIVGTIKGARTASNVELDKMGKDVLNVAGMFDKGTDEIASAANVMINTGLVKNWDEAISTITAGFQTAGAAGEDYLDTFLEFSDDFKRFGLDGESAVQLIASAVNAGMKDTDKFADALNEMSITIRDGSIDENILDIGLDPEKLRSDVAAGGESARAALIETLTALQADGDVANFQAFMGSLGEDFTSVFMNMDLSQVNSQFAEGVGNMTELDAANTTAASTLLSLKNTFTQLFVDLLVPTLDVVLPKVQAFTTFLKENEGIAKALAITLGVGLVVALVAITFALWGMAAAGWAAMAPFAVPLAIIAAVIAAIVLLVAAAIWLAENWDEVCQSMADAWDSLVGWIGDLWENVVKIANAIGEWFGDWFGGGDKNINLNSTSSVSGSYDSMPKMANGGTVPARPGGTAVILGEAGRDEVVMDSGKFNRLLDDLNKGGLRSGLSEPQQIVYNITQRENESTEELVDRIAEYQEMRGLRN